MARPERRGRDDDEGEAATVGHAIEIVNTGIRLFHHGTHRRRVAWRAQPQAARRYLQGRNRTTGAARQTDSGPPDERLLHPRRSGSCADPCHRTPPPLAGRPANDENGHVEWATRPLAVDARAYSPHRPTPIFILPDRRGVLMGRTHPLGQAAPCYSSLRSADRSLTRRTSRA